MGDLDAKPGAGVFHGFRRPLHRTVAEAAALDGSIMDLLAFHEVARGDCVFVPAGTVHAIGGGVRLFELQQSSDTTFRLYDYGRGRDLHLDEGLEVADLGSSEPTCEPSRLSDGRRLMSCAHFHIDEVTGTNITIDRRDVDGHWSITGFDDCDSIRRQYPGPPSALCDPAG